MRLVGQQQHETDHGRDESDGSTTHASALQRELLGVDLARRHVKPVQRPRRGHDEARRPAQEHVAPADVGHQLAKPFADENIGRRADGASEHVQADPAPCGECSPSILDSLPMAC